MKQLHRTFAAVVLVGALLCGCAPKEHAFGAGFVVGDPSGVSLKVWTGATTSVNCNMGWPKDAFHLHVDYVFHNFDFISVKQGDMAVYLGGGGKIEFKDDPKKDVVGIRFVFGLDYIIDVGNSVADVFIEVAPTLLVDPDLDFTADLAFGARYFF